MFFSGGDFVGYEVVVDGEDGQCLYVVFGGEGVEFGGFYFYCQYVEFGLVLKFGWVVVVEGVVVYDVVDVGVEVVFLGNLVCLQQQFEVGDGCEGVFVEVDVVDVVVGVCCLCQYEVVYVYVFLIVVCCVYMNQVFVVVVLNQFVDINYVVWNVYVGVLYVDVFVFVGVGKVQYFVYGVVLYGVFQKGFGDVLCLQGVVWQQDGFGNLVFFGVEVNVYILQSIR